jgi:hypothetical protein
MKRATTLMTMAVALAVLPGCSDWTQLLDSEAMCADHPTTEVELHMVALEERLAKLEGQLIQPIGEPLATADSCATQEWVLEQEFATARWVLDQGYVEGLGAYITVDEENQRVVIEGANLQLLSGAGATDAEVNGLGNLIIGYSADPSELGLARAERTGSHNLIVGDHHEWTSHGGVALGRQNTVSGPSAVALGGTEGVASGEASAIAGGVGATASGAFSTVAGGYQGLASGKWAAVAGGVGGEASGYAATVVGGHDNLASGKWSSAVGGDSNQATGHGASAALGGWGNVAAGEGALVGGGTSNQASGELSTISGGVEVVASADYDVR